MATATFNAAPDNSTDAAFRDWGSKLSTALASVGLVKTTDTGQIDWATVLKPASSGVKSGYEIWRFNDSVQPTQPLFLKIEYGSGGVAQSSISLWFTIGKGSNGSGTLTSTIGSVRNPSAFSPGFGTSGTWYVSSMDGSALCVLAAPTVLTQGNTTMYTLERSRTATGSPTGIGQWISYTTGANGSTMSIAYNSGNYSVATMVGGGVTNFSIPSDGYDVGLASGSAAPIVAPFVFDTVGTLWQPRSLLYAMVRDFTQFVPVTVTGWGTYLPLGRAPSGPTVQLLMAWS